MARAAPPHVGSSGFLPNAKPGFTLIEKPQIASILNNMIKRTSRISRETSPAIAARPSPDLSKNRLGTMCEVCGNRYDKPLEIVVNGISHYFDSFECAIQSLAPVCAHCQCRIIGHGMESGGTMFCCAHCAKQEGVRSVQDRT